MNRIAVVLLACSLTTICVAQERYQNKTWRFSFPIPEGWEAVAEEQIVGKYSTIVNKTFMDADRPAQLFEESTDGNAALEPDKSSRKKSKSQRSEPDSEQIFAVFQKTGSDSDNTAYMMIKATVLGPVTKDVFTQEHHMQEFLSSEGNRQDGLDRVKTLEKTLIERGKAEQFKAMLDGRRLHYSEETHSYLESACVAAASGRHVIGGMLRILGSNRMVTIIFHTTDENQADFLKMIDDLRSSFVFDKKYGYGEAPPSVAMKTFWKWIPPSLGIMLVTAFGTYAYINRD